MSGWKDTGAAMGQTRAYEIGSDNYYAAGSFEEVDRAPRTEPTAAAIRASIERGGWDTVDGDPLDAASAARAWNPVFNCVDCGRTDGRTRDGLALRCNDCYEKGGF